MRQIQLAADCGHAKVMYEGIKTATGPTSIKTAPIKSKTGEVITDQSMQLQRWVEHYLELYSTQYIVTDTTLNALPGLPVIQELDNTPTLEELSIAIDSHRGRMGSKPSCNHFMSSSARAGSKVTSPKT